MTGKGYLALYLLLTVAALAYMFWPNILNMWEKVRDAAGWG